MHESTQAQTIDAAVLGRAQERQAIENRFKGGAAWFFWVAALSLINSLIALGGGQWSFIFGLGATQIIDGFALGFAAESAQAGPTAKLLAFSLDLVVMSVYAFFGWYARRGASVAFAIGMVLYALDMLLVLAFQDFLGAAFHGWVLFGLFNGLRALRQLNAMPGEPGSELAGTSSVGR